MFLNVSLFSEDMYPPDSVEQLQKAGIEFQKHEEYGILPNDFAELMITSGLVLAPETKWISFHRWVGLSFMGSPCGAWLAMISPFTITGHSADHFLLSIPYDVLIDYNFQPCFSGYDFGYFVKLLTAESLPTTEDGFFSLLNIWFPTVYDIKFLMKASKLLKGGLQEVADDLGVRYFDRLSASHVFFELPFFFETFVIIPLRC